MSKKEVFLVGFVDIHTHLMFGVDDGSRDIKMTLKMLEVAILDGTTDLFLTPHYRLYLSSNTPQITRPLFNDIKERAAHLPINLYLGNEMRVDSKSLSAIKEKNFNTLNDSDYLLIDYPFSLFVGDPVEKILKVASIHPHIIVAHPERHSYTRSLSVIEDIKNKGILIQVNAGSILGSHGSESEYFAHELLENKLVDFVASDGHNLTSRPPLLSDAYNIVLNQYGQEVADDLFKNNAKKLLID